MKHPFTFYSTYIIDKMQEKEKYKLGEHEYRLKHPDFNGKHVLTDREFSISLQQSLSKEDPLLVARFGATELSCLRDFDFDRKSKQAAILKNMQTLSGFFPSNPEYGQRFTKLMKDSIPCIDYFAVWPQPFESYYMKHYGQSDVKYTWLRCLNPWACMQNPWTKALEGKKVLVIHPFSESIESQYQKRKEIWHGTEILPEFQLKTVKAVQTIAGEEDPRFHDWFEALDWMKNEALNQDFDIALIGCGAYGMPLAAELKKVGKSAVHLGGTIQILFGIMGRRWENNKDLKPFINDSWIRPLPSETPKGSDLVEHSCYW